MMRMISKNMVARARLVLEELKITYSNDPNILGFSIGYKERNGSLINRCSVKVYVRQKFQAALLELNQKFPFEKNGIAIDIVERPFQWHSDPLKKHDPLVGGVKVANQNNDGSYGTIGAIVNNPYTNDYYILSNWHILYGRANAQDGEVIVQPKNRSYYEIAKTSIGILSGKVDCALAKSNNSRFHELSILNITPNINGYLKEITPGIKVKKYGVNGVAYGIVTAVDASYSFTVPWSVNEHEMSDQMEIVPVEDKLFNIDEGDSGALWVTDEANPKAVGLHFAGVSYKSSMANPIYTVVQQLNDSGYEFIF